MVEIIILYQFTSKFMDVEFLMNGHLTLELTEDEICEIEICSSSILEWNRFFVYIKNFYFI